MKLKSVMNSAPFRDNPFLTWWLPILLGMLTTNTGFAADANPPEKMAYQGYMTDSNGDPLGATAPANYDTVFRIWSVLEGNASNDLLWSEQQTVTFDKGYFSVLLGEGSQYNSEPRGSLAAAFRSSTASDRFVGITVTGLTGEPVELVPRLKLVSSPYSFLAEHARSANRILGVDDSNQTVDVLKVSGENVGIGLDPNASPDKQLDVNGATQLRSSLEVKGQTNLEGPVAIGTGAAPTAQLDVQGDAKVSGAFSLANNMTITGGALDVSPAAGNSPLVLNYMGAPQHQLRVDMNQTRTWIRGTSNQAYLALGSNNIEALSIYSNGTMRMYGSLVGRDNTAEPIIYLDASDAGSYRQQSSTLSVGRTATQRASLSYDHLTQTAWVGAGSQNAEFRPSGGHLGFSYSAGGWAAFHNVGYISHRTGTTWNNGRTYNIFPYAYGMSIEVYDPEYASAWKSINFNGGTGWWVSSDIKLKKDIRDAEPMMDRLMQVPVRRFKWKGLSDDQVYDLGVDRPGSGTAFSRTRGT